jgi:hypothetical protein
MPRSPRPRYWPSRQAYYCQYRGKKHLLAAGPAGGQTLKVAWQRFREVIRGTPLEQLLFHETLEWGNPYKDAIRRLKAELDEARSTILALMPEETQRLLESYPSCESRQQTYSWQKSVAETIIESAMLPREQGSYFSDRAYCPLCGCGGFTIPEGLRRHLEGWGNMHKCDVMKAALGLAREYWHKQFHAAEQAEEVAKRECLEERKRTETLYRTMPDKDPQLLDEGYGTRAREQAQLVWAESRLAELGFQTTSEGNVKSYLSERIDFVIYADPRASGQITFRLYKKPLPKKGRTARLRSARISTFYLLDSWKNDIRGKYETRLSSAMATLS